jgi:hypothetical protein
MASIKNSVICLTTCDPSQFGLVVQEVPNQTTDTILITVNGGLLPPLDTGIVLQSVAGVVFQSQYTIDRISLPNRLILNTAPFSAIDYTVWLWTPT